MSIDFADNTLTDVLDADTFEGLTGLRKLTFSNNSISLPTEQSLFNLPHLEELHLRNCSLEGLSAELFANLNGLRVLDMSENPFKEVSFARECLAITVASPDWRLIYNGLAGT